MTVSGALGSVLQKHASPPLARVPVITVRTGTTFQEGTTEVRGIVNGLFVALAAWSGAGHAVNCGCTVVVEYHNTLLDHYFLAILPAEIAGIDAGRAGPGWVRTGETLITEDYGLFTYSRRVSRFYGSNEIGPNSHFFTIVEAESQMLRQIEADTEHGHRS